MGTFRALHQVHEALALRVRAAVAEAAESDGLGPVEVFTDLAADPAPGDAASVHVALARVAPSRELNFGPARRPSPLGGPHASSAAARGEGLFQAPPLLLNAWFLVLARADDARVADLLLGAVAASLHFDPTVARRPAPFLPPSEPDSAAPAAAPVDSLGRPLRRDRASPRGDAVEETVAVSAADDLGFLEVAHLLASFDREARPTLQYRAQVRIDAAVVSAPLARKVVARLR